MPYFPAAPAPVKLPVPTSAPTEASFEERVLDVLSGLAAASERIESELVAVAAALQRPEPATVACASGELAAPAAESHADAGSDIGIARTLFHQSSSISFMRVSEIKPTEEDLGHFVAPWLPQGWPLVLRRRQQLCEDKTSVYSDVLGRKSNFPPATFGSRRRHSLRFAYQSPKEFSDRAFRQAFFTPNSTFHMAYGITSLLIVVAELTVLPIVLAWDVSLVGWLQIFAWGTPSFWTIDIAINFSTGIYRKGELIMDWGPIALNYCRTWLALDIAVVVCDWVGLAVGLGSSSDTVRMVRFTKFGRVLRIAGMLRLVRVVRMIEDIAAALLSESAQLLCRLGTIFLSIMWAAHILSCVWFFVGAQAQISDTGATWFDGAAIEVHGQSLELLQTGASYQHSVSLHWAISQISLGTIDIMPRNTAERLVFTIATTMGFVFGSMLISIMSAGMIDFRMNKKDKVTKIRTLRRYLEENKANRCIARAVLEQITQRLSIQDKLEERDVSALSLLSRTLLSQLRFDISKGCFQGHPLFRLWLDLDATSMHRICDEAAAVQYLRAKDELFDAGAAATAAYVVSQGKFSYKELTIFDQRPSQGSQASLMVASEVGASAWVSEAALWVEWTHTGRLESVAESRILAIDACQMLKQLQHPALKAIAMEYSFQFHRGLVSARPPLAKYPSDVAVPFTDYCELVCAMSHGAQTLIGMQALQQMGHGFLPAARCKLEDEIIGGRSSVMVTGDGSVLRAVLLVVLRLLSASGHVFAQVGRLSDSGVVEPLCQLPGTKKEFSETVGQSLKRLIDSHLGSLLTDKIEVCTVEREVTETKSKTAGIPTRYVRMVGSAKVKVAETIDAPVTPYSSFAPLAHIRSAESEFPDLMHRTVWTVHMAHGPGKCYAWLAPEEFAFLTSGPRGEAALASWVSTLAPPAGALATDWPSSRSG